MVDDRREASPLGIKGIDAWLGQTLEHINAQTTQILCLGALLQGAGERNLQVREVAETYEVPLPRKAGKTAQSRSIDRLRDLALRDRTLSTFSDAKIASEWEASAVPGEPLHEVWSGLGAEDPRGASAVGESIVVRLWNQVRARSSARSALALIGEGLNSRHGQVRAISAAVIHIVHEPYNAQAHEILRTNLDAQGYAAEFAAIALGDQSDDASSAHMSVDVDGSLDPLVRDGATEVSVVVHGTFARLIKASEKWYHPQADLPTLIRRECTPSLYSGALYYRWDAGYSDAARMRASDDLMVWCRDRGVQRLDTVYAHSHGGNVVLNAVEAGLEVDLLVLLHTPVLPRSDSSWANIARRVKRILDIRTPADWIVMLDGIKTNSRNELPTSLQNARRLTPQAAAHFQTSHFRYTKDTVWRSLGLTSDVLYERSMAH